ARRQLRPGVLQPMSGEEIRDTVKAKYGQAATRVLGGGQGGSCACDPVSSNLYDAAETAAVPEGAVRASLGCGNPTALAELHEGEVVLDLGSGGGIDVLLSARRRMELLVGCVAGALEEEEYKGLLAAAGFVDVGIERTRIYEEVGGRIMGAFVRARKPV